MFTVWNLAGDSTYIPRRGGHSKYKKLKKWEFYSVAAEEMMTYNDVIEEVRISRDTSQVKRHTPVIMSRDYPSKAPTYIIFSMEKEIMRHIIEIKNNKGRKHSRRRACLAICSNQNCNIICHVCYQENSRMREIHKFAGLSCFEIYHHEDCKDLFVIIHRGNCTYSSSLRNHSVRKLITEIYKDGLPRRGERTIT